ncbi:MAG: molybdopterin converting factor subunit 1 [Anaerolineales bacterium]
MNKITVIFFATFRDKAGTSRAEFEIPAGSTIEELREILTEHFPALESLADHALAAINKEVARPGQIVPEGAEVAWFPPVGGG